MVFGSGCRLAGAERSLAGEERKAASSSPYGFPASTLAPKKQTYSRGSRITREKDLSSVQRTGHRVRTRFIEARVVSSPLSTPRMAVIVGKYGHSVVERNKLKRRIRELGRTRLLPFVEAIDLVVRALPAAYDASFDQLAQEADQLSEQLRSGKSSA